MNIEDFNLLTQEEIDEVIAEVLSEAPRTRRGEVKPRDFDGDGDVDDDDLKTAADIEAGVRDDPADAQKPQGGISDRGDPGIGAGIAKAQRAGTVGAGHYDTNPSKVKDSRGMLKRARGAVQNFFTGKDTVGGGATSNKYGDADYQSQLQTPPDADTGIGGLTANWFKPGSSNVPEATKKRIASHPQFGGQEATVSPVAIVSSYLVATYGPGEVQSLARETNKKMTLARIDNAIKKANQTKDPNDAMTVRRMLDSLIALSAANAPAKPEPGPDPKPEPVGVTPPEKEQVPEDDKGKDIPVPVNKKLSKDQREAAGLSGGAAGSLASQLAKLFPNVDKKIITQILKDVAGQLKANGIEIQEGKKLALRLMLEQEVKSRLISEKRYDDGGEKHAAIIKDLITRFEVKPGEVKKIKKAKGISSKPSLLAVNKNGEGRIYSVDKGKEGEDSAEAGATQAKKWAASGEKQDSDLFKKFKETLKRLDLHTSEGRAAAKDNDQAYLGAFRYFRAMQAAFKAIKGDKLEQSTDKLMKMVEPLNEKSGENEHAAGKDFRTWLANMINIFKEEGLDDRARGMAAMKAARKGRMPGSGSDAPETKADKTAAAEKEKAAGAETDRRAGKAGTINTKSVVGPRLKQGGVDLKSPEGQKLQKQMQKVIRRFIKKNLGRIGKNDLKVIAEDENLTNELVAIIKEHLS